MLIFVTADIHGNNNFLSQLSRLPTKPDLLLIAGDVGPIDVSHTSVLDLGKQQKKWVANLDFTLDQLDYPAYYILGNDDWFDLTQMEHRHYLDKPMKIGEDVIIPFESVNRTPYNTNRECNEHQLLYALDKFSAIGNNAIVLAHTPPYKYGDKIHSGERVGSKAALDFIMNRTPKAWLCGHIHEDYSMNKVGKTIILNSACAPEQNIFRGFYFDTVTCERTKHSVFAAIGI